MVKLKHKPSLRLRKAAEPVIQGEDIFASQCTFRRWALQGPQDVKQGGFSHPDAPTTAEFLPGGYPGPPGEHLHLIAVVPGRF